MIRRLVAVAVGGAAAGQQQRRAGNVNSADLTPQELEQARMHRL